jgi:hypothetical protein
MPSRLDLDQVEAGETDSISADPGMLQRPDLSSQLSAPGALWMW